MKKTFFTFLLTFLLLSFGYFMFTPIKETVYVHDSEKNMDNIQNIEVKTVNFTNSYDDSYPSNSFYSPYRPSKNDEVKTSDNDIQREMPYDYIELEEDIKEEVISENDEEIWAPEENILNDEEIWIPEDSKKDDSKKKKEKESNESENIGEMDVEKLVDIIENMDYGDDDDDDEDDGEHDWLWHLFNDPFGTPIKTPSGSTWYIFG